MAPNTNLLSRVAVIAATVVLLLLANSTSAQSMFRSVGPDGRITYSDRAPAAGTKASVERRVEAPSSAPEATLPYELREVAGRHPVTLYTATDCAPCTSARALLNGRGIPFAERTISSNDDITALKALSSDGSLPFATLGSQPLRGFELQEWQRNLDAAGYPKTSQLPTNWRAAAATPLAPRTQAAAAPVPAAAPANAEGRASVNSTERRIDDRTSNPAGIRF